MSRTFVLPVAVFASLLGSAPVAAHGLGQRYDLPLPLGLYLSGAAAAVALSFVVMALPGRWGLAMGSRRQGSIRLLSPRARDAAPVRLATTAVRAAGLALFALIVAAGLFGHQDPFKNLAPISVWVIGWVGLAFVCALLGDVWRLINPFDTAFRLLEAVAGSRPTRARAAARLGVWPAVALFVVFAWCELVWPSRDQPAALAWALLIYAGVTWAGMWWLGRVAWLRHGEIFAVAFGLLARFAPTVAGEQGGLRLRPPAGGLAVHEPVSWSLTAFALLMLSTVTFDGVLETPAWADLAEAALASPGFTALAAALGVPAYPLLQTLGLLASPLVFGGLYLAVAAGMAAAARRAGATAESGEIARLFVLSLVPIAIAYHLAHYLTYLLIAGQYVIPLISDPFGAGWDLFGTKLYFVDIGVIDARTAWRAAVGLIVVGHLIAVWLSHVQAERRFPTHRAVLASQIPMLLLMVAYTATSLWILAQPITEFSGG